MHDGDHEHARAHLDSEDREIPHAIEKLPLLAPWPTSFQSLTRSHLMRISHRYRCSGSSKVDGSCPALPGLRTNTVSESFDPAGLAGLWYEWAYADVAQVGASCQTLNSTLPDTHGVINMAFRVDYAG